MSKGVAKEDWGKIKTQPQKNLQTIRVHKTVWVKAKVKKNNTLKTILYQSSTLLFSGQRKPSFRSDREEIV